MYGCSFSTVIKAVKDKAVSRNGCFDGFANAADLEAPPPLKSLVWRAMSSIRTGIVPFTGIPEDGRGQPAVQRLFSVGLDVS